MDELHVRVDPGEPVLLICTCPFEDPPVAAVNGRTAGLTPLSAIGFQRMMKAVVDP
jgi:hypothetical protein